MIETSASRLRSLAMIPGALIAVLPAVSCPACLGAYAGLLTALGVPFVLAEKVLVPVTGTLLMIGLISVGWSTRTHHQPGPLAATLAGTLAVVFGRLIFRLPPLLYLGVGMLIASALWNLWLKRPKAQVLVQLTIKTRRNPSCGNCS